MRDGFSTISRRAVFPGPRAAFTLPKRPRPRVFLDLDGVMADFDAYFPALFGVDHRDLADDVMWEQITSAGTFFRDMPVCPGALDFFDDLKALNVPVSILTACPKSNYAHVATQKREWVREHLGTDVTVIPTAGGTAKPLFMHAAGDILIDDFDRNCASWAKAGGLGIHHTGAFWHTFQLLQEALA